MTKQEYVEWRNHPVTRAFKEDVFGVIEAAAAELISRTAPNPERDTFLKGFVAGAKQLPEWEPQEFNNEG